MHAGSNDSTMLALEGLQATHVLSPWALQAGPVLIHADMGAGQCHQSPPSNLQTTVLSNVRVTETVSDQQAAVNAQVSHSVDCWQAYIDLIL